jgi:hypothetical protein
MTANDEARRFTKFLQYECGAMRDYRNAPARN